MHIRDFSLSLFKDATFTKDGILFNNVSYIKLLVDGRDIFEDIKFRDSFIYFSELKKTMQGDGKYLIFTCACGVADDGGWDGIWVSYSNDIVQWRHSELDIDWSFDINQYFSSILVLEKKIEGQNHRLEPRNVVFPEYWDVV